MPQQKLRFRPKQLEKILFLNHREDQVLRDRLDRLQLISRVKEIELDRERIKVRNELRNSRKRQVQVEPTVVSRKDTRDEKARPKTTVFRSHSVNVRGRSSLEDDDGVNAYLLGEYRRMSEVIPSILRALAAKEEKENESKSFSKNFRNHDNPGGYGSDKTVEWQEPDIHKVRKIVDSIKTLRHNMSINKKLEYTKPNVPLSKRFKDLRSKDDELDQYTDGACVLLKRKIDKRRKESVADSELPAFMKRQENTGDSTDRSYGLPSARSSGIFGVESASNRRPSVPAPSGIRRRTSMMSRSALGPRSFTSISRSSFGKVDNNESMHQFIDEDQLIRRKRVELEIEKYKDIRSRIDNFLATHKSSISDRVFLAT